MYTMGHLTIHLTLALLLVCLHMKGFVAPAVRILESPEEHIDESALAKLKSLVDQNLQVAMTKIYELKIYIDGEYSGEVSDIKEESSCIIDCSKATLSGVHTITKFAYERKLHCHVESDGVKWVVIQRREDGSVNFTRNWANYSEGFGDLAGEFWLGNDNIHILTAGGLSLLRIDLEGWQGRKYTVYYNTFKVADEQDKYRLTVSGFHGAYNAGDSFSDHTGMEFSTYDQDNDDDGRTHCALQYQGGWWYTNCLESNLNGVFNITAGFKGIHWLTWPGNSPQVKKSTMMIRRP